MTIVGTDGLDRMVIEGDEVTDLAIPCAGLQANGRHVIRFIDLSDFTKSVCQHCHQTVATIRIKGEALVY